MVVVLTVLVFGRRPEHVGRPRAQTLLRIVVHGCKRRHGGRCRFSGTVAAPAPSTTIEIGGGVGVGGGGAGRGRGIIQPRAEASSRANPCGTG